MNAVCSLLSRGPLFSCLPESGIHWLKLVKMAPQQPQQKDDSKDDVAMQQIDRAETTEDVLKPTYEKVDEFGAHTKTDPKEIALVRKLDLFCLVR